MNNVKSADIKFEKIRETTEKNPENYLEFDRERRTIKFVKQELPRMFITLE